MLTVARALDNNAVLVSLNHERQALVQGKGIGFNKKPGDLVAPERVEKILGLCQSVLNSSFIIWGLSVMGKLHLLFMENT